MNDPVSSRRLFRGLGSALQLAILLALPWAVPPARAQAQMAMPTSLATVSQIPLADPTVSFGGLAGLRFGPNGQLYASTGTAILEQTGGYAANFATTIGTISTAGSDPGPFNFSQDGQTILVSNGFGGSDPTGSSGGNLFTLAVPNGSAGLSIVPTAAYVANIPSNADIVAVPASSGMSGSQTKFFIDVGTATGSEVDVFDSATGAAVPVITGIQGASTSIGVAGGNLYVGNGFDFSGMNATGQLESFSLSSVAAAANSYSKTPQSPQPLSWGTGTMINGTGGGNNSGAGIFVDPRGYLFTGGDAGLLVVAPSGQTYSYANSNFGYVSVAYNAVTNQFALSGYDQNGNPLIPTIYSASQFGVAAANLLNWTGSVNSSWDTTVGSSNWVSAIPCGNNNFSASSYRDTSTVIFGDTNPYNNSPVFNAHGNSLVNIASGGVAPAAVMFTNTGAANGGVDYTILGGPIGGAATIELYGNGTSGGDVVLTNANTFTGPVVVAAGVLTLQNSAALGNSSGVSVIAGASVELQSPPHAGLFTFGLTATGSNSIPLNLYGTGVTNNAGELNSVGGNNIYGGAINVGSGGGQIVSSSSAGSDQLTLSGGVDVSTGATLTIAGPGKTTITGAGLSLANSSSILVNSGTLEFNLAAGTATVSLGSGTTTTVAAGATLQLAGNVSALYDPASGNRMDVVYQGSSASSGGLTIADGSQTVGVVSGIATTSGGTITYSGDTVVAPGASLTADQILQNTLTIGAGATVTLRPAASGDSASENISTAIADSSSSADSLAAIQYALADGSNAGLAIERLQDRIALLNRVAATDPALDVALSNADALLQSLETTWSSESTSLSSLDDPGLTGLTDADGAILFDANTNGSSGDLGSVSLPGGEIAGAAAVPEPATAVLLLIAAIFLLPTRRRICGCRTPSCFDSPKDSTQDRVC